MQAHQDERRNEAMRLLAYDFNRPGLMSEALQTPGSGVLLAGDRSVIDGNKIMALLGDSLIRTFVIEMMVNQNKATRDAIDAQVQRSVNNVRLAEIFDTFGFVTCLNLNPSQGLAIGARTKADTIKAIIGAVYMDGGDQGLDAVRRVAAHLNII
ncbi:ribonuclease III domain-containing protein [Colletotrichum godetiae]|uniref:Ribonuclease III domain-containing protein n=1 Tax=Colletotrichum godetiae TaxID=1209918 RepID=A0AAJ0A986_9PEZI|nr:ribonuclease III domain-containing protein [Colletotrichum godetiae]KAK1658881.1 ribonuclease III domain-containing protein [Colletotrichum godetiae]